MTRQVTAAVGSCLLLTLLLSLIGCGPSPSSPGSTVTARASDPAPSMAPSLVPSPSLTASPSSAETRPPAATLIEADGHGVEGQVGTFAWQGVVSDSPLLSGAAATVRARQTLSISIAGPRPTSWTATLFTDPSDPASGTPFGEGAGEISLAAPNRPGTWTLRVQVRDPAGEVTHYWRLTVIR